jgi:hypothetical protein
MSHFRSDTGEDLSHGLCVLPPVVGPSPRNNGNGVRKKQNEKLRAERGLGDPLVILLSTMKSRVWRNESICPGYQLVRADLLLQACLSTGSGSLNRPNMPPVPTWRR